MESKKYISAETWHAFEVRFPIAVEQIVAQRT
jgi:hypothetical protein